MQTTTTLLPATATRPAIQIERTPDHHKLDASVLQHPSGQGVIVITSAPPEETKRIIAG